MIGRYKDFEIYEVHESASRFRRSYYWTWSINGYLTVRGEIENLRKFGGDTDIFCFFDILDLENALSIFYGEPVKLHFTITRRELV